MIVDCMSCPVRAQRCDDCVVTVLREPGPAAHLAPPEQLESSEGLWPTEHQLPGELQLDVAERRVVSMFVGAGLVNAGAVARLRARRESVQHWGVVRDVG